MQFTEVGDGVIYVDGAALPILRQPANFNSGSDQILVAAVAGLKIRVIWGNALASTGGCTLTFKSKGAGAGTPISPAYPNGANGGFVFPRDPNGIFETNVGEALAVDCTGAIAIMIGYVEV